MFHFPNQECAWCRKLMQLIGVNHAHAFLFLLMILAWLFSALYYGCPEKKCRQFQKKLYCLREHITYSVSKRKPIAEWFKHPRYCIKQFWWSFIGWENTIKKLDTLVQKYNSSDAEYCEQLVSTSNIYRKGKKSFFDEYTELEFEGKMYPAIKEYDKYLRNILGRIHL